jgi:hypothetical protein
MLSKSGKKAEIMGIQGRKKVERKYTIEIMCKGMYGLYLKNIKQNI